MGIKDIFNKKTFYYLTYVFVTMLFFVWYLFPSEYVAGWLEKMINAKGNGVTISIDGVKPDFPVGIQLTGVEVSVPSVAVVPVDYINVKVTLFSLIKFNPVIRVSTGIFGGDIEGDVKIPDGDINKMSVEDISVSDLDVESCAKFAEEHLKGYQVKGNADAEGSYAAAGRGHGNISLTLKDFVVKPEKPFLTLEGLSFSKITTDVEFKSKRIQIEKCEIDGLEFDGSVKGTIIVKKPFSRSVLRLSGKFKPEKEFAEKMPLELVFKKKVKAGDELPFKISGTVKKPKFR